MNWTLPPSSPFFSRFHPQVAEERRLYRRFSEHGMMARLGQALVDIHDISVGGVCLDGIHGEPGITVELQLMARDGRNLDVSQAVWVMGEVLGHIPDGTRIRFPRITYTLAKFIINHLARQNGLEPYIFK